MRDNVIEVDFAAGEQPMSLEAIDAEVKRISAAFDELERDEKVSLRKQRIWQSWERRRLFACIRGLREELRAERVNQVR